MRQLKALLITVALAVAFLASSISAHAVNVLTTNKLCPASVLAVQTINSLPVAYPKDWTIVIACSDAEWNFLQRKADAFDTHHAFTNFKGKMTIVRGDIFLNPEMGRSPAFILLHELGHIDCACNDENRADKFADQHYYRGERK